MYVFTAKGWVSTGITKLKVGDNIDVSPTTGNAIITDNLINIGTNTSDNTRNSLLVGFVSNITDVISGGNSVFGYKNTIKKGRLSTLVGEGNNATGQKTAVFGNCNTITSTDATSEEITDSSNWNTTLGQWNTVADCYTGTIVGAYNKVSKGIASIVLGYNNTLSGKLSVALGSYNTTNYNTDVAIGYKNTVDGASNIAIGYQNSTANGNSATALGFRNIVSGEYSYTLGFLNTVDGVQSTAIGGYNTISENCTTVLGYSNTAKGTQSCAVGWRNTTTNKYEMALGYYNLSEEGITEFSVGNGYKTSEVLKQHNILMSNQAGDLYIVEKTPTDDSSILYYEAPMKRLQTWLNEKADKIPTSSTSQSAVTLQPNANIDITLNGDLSLTLQKPTDTSIVNTYMASIATGDSVGTINLPSNVKWEEDITFEANSMYVIKILYNAKGYFGTINSWKL